MHYTRVTGVRYVKDSTFTHNFVCAVVPRGEKWHASITYREVAAKKPEKLQADMLDEGSCFQWIDEQVVKIMGFPLNKLVFEKSWDPKN